MADVEIAAHLSLDANDGIKSMKDFRRELKEAQGDAIALADKFGAASEEAAAATKKVAELRDKMDETRKLTEAFNPETKFRAFGAAINTVVGGFASLQGIMGLVGAESDDLQKGLLKVQSALALSQGVAQFQEGIKAFKNLGAVIQATTIFQKANAAATQAASVVMKLFGGAVDTTSTSFKVLKGAIAATGIGLVVIAITQVIDLVKDWTSSTDDAAKSQEELAKQIENVNSALEGQTKFFGREEALDVAKAKRAGATEAQIFEIKQRYRRLEFQATSDAYDKLKVVDEKAAHEKIERLKELNNQGQVAQIEFETAEAERKRKAAEEANRKALEQAVKDAAIRTQLAAGRIRGTVGVARDKTPEEIELDAKLAATKDYYAKVSELRKTDNEDEALASFELNRLSRERMAQEEAEYQNKKTLTEAGAALLGAVADLVGKQTAAGKVLAIAQATINTFLGATEVLRAPTLLPEPLGTIVKIANVATVIATGLSAIKNIVKTQVPGGSGGGNVPSISAVSPPLAPQRPGTTTTQLDQQSLNAIGNATVRAFVVESDVTNNQERIRRLNRAARI